MRAGTATTFSVFYNRSERGVVSGVALNFAGSSRNAYDGSQLSNDVPFSTGLRHSLIVAVTKLGHLL